MLIESSKLIFARVNSDRVGMLAQKSVSNLSNAAEKEGVFPRERGS